MEIATKYEPQQIENKWYSFWMEHKLFASVPNQKPPFTIVIPPPNVTGILHMGHMLNNTIQDILVRRARMQGFNAVWVPGTDHASIATEAKVVAMLKEKGIDKKDLSREEFLNYAWQWKEKHGGIILQQLKKLGASCDWDRTKFTMDADLSEAVIDVFIDLYRKGLIYRGVRMVNWDPQALTAVSDEEVVYQEVQSKLYYVRYQIEGVDNEFVTIATTRPETILGDTAICMHPDDDRYQHLKGKRAIVPLVNRSIPLIFDEYVDREFGTGALKITPAHDINDYNLGIKYRLDSINIFNDNGTLNESAQILVGMERFAARDAIIPLLEKSVNLVKIEDYINKVGYSERTQVAIEPKLSMQWFCKISSLAKPAMDVVMNDEIKFYPDKFKNTYSYWMENVKDWCISRQLWWGHRIPAFYLPNNEYVVAKNKEEALALAQQKFPEQKLTTQDIKQDEDVLDTWFSSWLWPMSVFDGMRNPDNDDIKYYYPTNVLITAPDIIFFWVARMIMAGLEWRKQVPFKHVYFTGTVRDKQRRKMSKSLGNSPDPIMLMEQFGADGVRLGMLLSSPAGNDLLFDESLCEQGRNFSNKIWNAFRLIRGWEIDEKAKQPIHTEVCIKWFRQRFNQALAEINDNFDKFRISDALMSAYKLVWDDFCACFLEVVKPAYQKPIDGKSFREIIDIFDDLMKVLHPFMPFITEELWHNLKERGENESIMIAEMPRISDEKDTDNILERFATVRKVVENVRRVRAEKNIAQKNQLPLLILKSADSADREMDSILIKLCNLSDIQYVTEKSSGTCSFIEQNVEYMIPIAQNINVEEELKRLNEELAYTQSFRESVLKKLSNERFVNNAPEQVVATERKKQADAEEKIKLLQEQIANLK
ncbi:MAG: valine--tRNA ligase [Bacteroidales bacterium]|nr:valine--tRNA ligase [Bacteroidales bacterium]